MIIVDSNVLIGLLDSSRALPQIEILVPDDLYDEYVVAETRHNKKIEKVKKASSLEGFDECGYLKEYARMLNKYTGVNFAKMRGFADVSILALTSCMVSGFKRLSQTSIDFGTKDTTIVSVVTSDDKLRKMLRSEFGKRVDILDSLHT